MTSNEAELRAKLEATLKRVQRKKLANDRLEEKLIPRAAVKFVKDLIAQMLELPPDDDGNLKQ